MASVTVIITYNGESKREFERCFSTAKAQIDADCEIITVGIKREGCLCAESTDKAKELSGGDYFCVVPASCRLSPLFCAKMSSFCEKHGTDVAVCGYMLIGKRTPAEQIGVPLRLYREEVLPLEQAEGEADKGFNRLRRKIPNNSGCAAVTEEPLIFKTK